VCGEHHRHRKKPRHLSIRCGYPLWLRIRFAATIHRRRSISNSIRGKGTVNGQYPIVGNNQCHSFNPASEHKAASLLFNLPGEVRERIYTSAIPKVECKIVGLDDLDRVCLAEAIGVPSGLYFPSRNDLAILRVIRQVRQESLLLAYRRAFSRLDDMDIIKLLTAVGRTGRENSESFQFRLFESELMQRKPLRSFKADPGI